MIYAIYDGDSSFIHFGLFFGWMFIALCLFWGAISLCASMTGNAESYALSGLSRKQIRNARIRREILAVIGISLVMVWGLILAIVTLLLFIPWVGGTA